MATVNFGGKWKLEKNENFDEFLKAMNVGMLMRAAASKGSPVLEITQDGDKFTIITKGARTNEVTFKMGEQFTTKDPLEGKDVTMMPAWEGDKQVITNVNDSNGVKITRELEGGKLVQTQTKGSVTCKRIFAKQS